jgi:hypothetical protein
MKLSFPQSITYDITFYSSNEILHPQISTLPCFYRPFIIGRTLTYISLKRLKICCI